MILCGIMGGLLMNLAFASVTVDKGLDSLYTNKGRCEVSKKYFENRASQRGTNHNAEGSDKNDAFRAAKEGVSWKFDHKRARELYNLYIHNYKQGFRGQTLDYGTLYMLAKDAIRDA